MRKIIIPLIIILLIWIIISFIFKPPEYIFPNPISVVKCFIGNYGVFLENTAFTLLEVLLGFIIANGFRIFFKSIFSL